MKEEVLAKQTCEVCEVGGKPLTKQEADNYLKQISGWKIKEYSLFNSYTFPDFKSALLFVNQVGEVAEQQGHHPEIIFTWGKVDISLYTHSIKGLSKNDFILAAKIDKIR